METFHGVTVSFHLSVYKFTTDKICILSGRTISILSDVIGERCALKSAVSAIPPQRRGLPNHFSTVFRGSQGRECGFPP